MSQNFIQWLFRNILPFLEPKYLNPEIDISVSPAVEACVAEGLTTQTPDPEFRDSSLALRVVYLDKELFSTLSLLTQVYKWVPARG